MFDEASNADTEEEMSEGMRGRVDSAQSGRDSAPASDEAAIRVAFRAADHDLATSLALRRYGGEVYGFLVARSGSPSEADDAFASFAERLWKTMPRFEWKCSMRTWAYRLARSAHVDARRARSRAYGGERVDLSSSLGELAAAIRSETISLLRTERRDALDELRMTLDADDRELLVLRLSRDLSWREIALVLDPQVESDDESAIARECARLRKRFQLVRSRLRGLAAQRGLL